MTVPNFLALKSLSPAVGAGAGTALSSPLGGRPPPPAGSAFSRLPFQMEVQQQDQWCWAAVSVSCAHFYGAKSWTQCKVACAEMGGDCCSDHAASEEPCNRSHYLDRALARVGQPRDVAAPVSFAALKGEIDDAHPLPCRIGWRGSTGALDGSGHFVTVSGWTIAASGAAYLDIEDPWHEYGHSYVPFDVFCHDYKSAGQWTHAYPRPGAGGGAPLCADLDETLGG